jgi:hypothetical protein
MLFHPNNLFSFAVSAVSIGHVVPLFVPWHALLHGGFNRVNRDPLDLAACAHFPVLNNWLLIASG